MSSPPRPSRRNASRKIGVAVEVVEGDVEEALDLTGVKIDGQHPGRASGGQEIGDELGGDRGARLDLAVLAGVAGRRVGNSVAEHGSRPLVPGTHHPR